MGLYEERKLGVFLCLREKKKSLFLVRSKKESLHRGKENHSLLLRIIWSGPIGYTPLVLTRLYSILVSQLFTLFEFKSKCELRDGQNQFARRVRTRSASNFSCDIALTPLLTSISLLLFSLLGWRRRCDMTLTADSNPLPNLGHKFWSNASILSYQTLVV